MLCRNSLYNDRVARLATQARARNRTILFDVDDLVFDPTYVHLLMDTLGLDMRMLENWDDRFGYVGRVGATYSLCDGALVTNAYLAARAEAWSGKPTRIIPNFLNHEQHEISDRIWEAKMGDGWDRDGRTHLGYFSGSPSHNRDFALVAPTIGHLMDEDPSLWLRVVGFLDPVPELARHLDRIEFLPLQDFLNLQREIGAVEINLVPLRNNPFTDCKSELKWFEFPVVGALTIASPTYSSNYHRPWVQRLVATPQAWDLTLREVLRDLDAHRPDVAPRAREEARDRYGWDRQRAVIEFALFESW